MLQIYPQSFVSLSEDFFIDNGGRRKCYRHPFKPNLCIKVLQSHINKDKQASREIRYYSKYKEKGVPHTHLTKFHGTINISKGQGLMFELMSDHNGMVSKTLEYYLKNKSISMKRLNVLLSDLHHYLLEYHIHLSDLSTDNIVVHVQQQREKLIIVDGAVNSDFIKICDYSEYFRRKKIQRKWLRFIDSLKNF